MPQERKDEPGRSYESIALSLGFDSVSISSIVYIEVIQKIGLILIYIMTIIMTTLLLIHQTREARH